MEHQRARTLEACLVRNSALLTADKKVLQKDDLSVVPKAHHWGCNLVIHWVLHLAPWKVHHLASASAGLMDTSTVEQWGSQTECL